MENQNSHESRRARQRYSREEKQRHLLDQAASGLSVTAYCRQHGIRYGNFRNWQRQGSKSTPAFRPMELVAGNESRTAVAEVRFTDGTMLLVREGCTEQMARVLVKVLS